MPSVKPIAVALFVVLGTPACEDAPEPDAIPSTRLARESPPEPVVTYSAADAAECERLEHGEFVLDIDEARRLHAQHHPHTRPTLGSTMSWTTSRLRTRTRPRRQDFPQH